MRFIWGFVAAEQYGQMERASADTR